MNYEAILFYIIAAFILASGLLAVTAARIFRAAIWLLSSLIGVAALYFWMSVPFIAAMQIVVYAGGIVVLIIFSIFLTQDSGKTLPRPMMRRKLFALLATVSGFLFTGNLITQYGFTTAAAKPFGLTVQAIGFRLLDTTGTGFLLPFELVSVLLLASMVGCIVIAMKQPPERETTVPVVKGEKTMDQPARQPAIPEPITEEV